MDDRSQEEIHEKGFDLYEGGLGVDFSKLKIAGKILDDAILDITQLRTNNPLYKHPFFRKDEIIQALLSNDLPKLRAISRFWYKFSGIYERIANFFATLYRYDWYIVPEIYDDKILDNEVKQTKVLQDFAKVLNLLDNTYIKKICGEMALDVVLDGAYYGYLVQIDDSFIIQKLPIEYCRSRFYAEGMPVVEFNMSFFDTIKDIQYRMKVLDIFPEEFKKGYLLFKQGKLPADTFGECGKWYMLTPGVAFKFNFNGSDTPTLLNAIPALIDLDAAQALDRRKQMQDLLKILVQKLPRDKNGDLIFDVDEAKDIHLNAVKMLANAVGVDVLTTFADVEAISLKDKNTTTTADELEKVERTVFNAFGVSQNLFNTDGNLSLEKSVLIDESNVRNLLLQFSIFFDRLTQRQSPNKKKYNFKFYMLETTQFNYKEMAKLYKEQTQIGYSKMLPQIALGHSQSFILNSITFENNVLHLSDIMIPPLMSSTMSSADVLGNKNQSTTQKNQNSTGEENNVGRPQKSEGEKSDKTLANNESMEVKK